MKTRYTDKRRETLSRLLTAETQSEASRYAFRTLQGLHDEIALRRLGKNPAECDAAEAGDVLRESIERATQELAGWAQGYSASRWLWMLRRIPSSVFEGTLSTTPAYDSALAEVISGKSRRTTQTRFFPADRIDYSLEGATTKRLARFCEGIRFLSHLHRCYRWAGKGTRFRFESGRSPQALSDPVLSAAIALYDRRVELSSRPLSRMGTAISVPDLSERSGRILWIGRISPTDLPVPPPGKDLDQPFQNEDFCEVRANYFPVLLSIDSLYGLLSDKRIDPSTVISDEVASLVCFLACVISLFIQHAAGFLSLATVGYLAYESDRFQEILRSAFAELPSNIREIAGYAEPPSCDSVLERIASMGGNEWPLTAGPMLRYDGSVVLVDLLAACDRLNAALEFPRIQGRMANARSEHLENHVQALIDTSEWAPDQTLRSLRRRELRRGGKTITDIDAIGSKSNSVILVSCKSMIYSAAYDIGDYTAVRNSASTISSAVKDLDRFLEDLRSNPVGDNFDLSKVSEMWGVVCVPHPIFSTDIAATRFVRDGLRVCVSLEEFAQWLRVDSFLPWGKIAEIAGEGLTQR